MLILSWGGALLVVAFGVHVIIWRLARPSNSGFALVMVFLAVLAAGAAAMGILAEFAPAVAPGGWSAVAHIVFLYVAGMSGYINTYPAIEVDSPTLRLMHVLSQVGRAGLDMEGVRAAIGDEYVVGRRFDNLINENMAFRRGDRLVLAPKGRVIATVFGVFRGLVGRGLGG